MARGRKAGAPNYQNNILIRIISNVKPNGALLWQLVADMYHKESGETEPRNPDNLKKHWNINLCNKGCKPTGRSGTINDRILHCIRIQGEILKKTDSVMMGIESDDDDDDMYTNNNNGVLNNNEEEEEEEDEVEDEEEDSKPAAIDDATVALLVEAAVDSAPPCPIMGHATNVGAGAGTGFAAASAAAAAVGAATGVVSIARAAGITAVGATNVDAAAVAGRAADVGVLTAGSTKAKTKKAIKVNEKTKNSTNVNHERGSIRKTMDKLADALIARPAPVPAPAVDHAVMVERHVMGHLVSMEMDRVMNVHRGYLRDLDRRARENAKMLKRVMKSLSNNRKKKAKKMKSAEGEKKNDEENGNSDSDEDSSSSSSSSNEE